MAISLLFINIFWYPLSEALTASSFLHIKTVQTTFGIPIYADITNKLSTQWQALSGFSHFAQPHHFQYNYVNHVKSRTVKLNERGTKEEK